MTSQRMNDISHPTYTHFFVSSKLLVVLHCEGTKGRDDYVACLVMNDNSLPVIHILPPFGNK